MSKRKRAAFFCDTCDLQFKYRCKYARHLDSASHRRFSEVKSMMHSREVSSDEETFADQTEDYFQLVMLVVLQVDWI